MEKKFDLDDYTDIRPYTDEECLPVINRLLKNNKLFFQMAKMAFPRITRVSPTWGALLSRWAILIRLRQVGDIASFQEVLMAWFFFRMLNKTSDGISHQWLEDTVPGQGNLFLSNHRDIAVDPAVVAHSLFVRKQPLPMVGIGDNLLANSHATDIMKLNRCFIVKRTLESAKQMLLEMKKLSSFIRYSVDGGNNVWLAHREGRAKDSRDKTSPTVIKMLKLSRGKDESWAESLSPLNIRTVSISYQYDPCVVYKAKALLAGKKSKKTGADSADLEELSQGVVGKKGKVHVVIGKSNNWHADISLPEVIDTLDRQIISNYKLYNSHFYCLQKLVDMGLEDKDKLLAAQKQFGPHSTECKLLDNTLTDKLGQDVYTTCLRIYANPILEKLALLPE